jgi:F-type H+-transporting ATPase subunit b
MLELEPYKLMWSLINFLVLLYLLRRFLYTPVVKMLDERRTTIENSLKQADEARAEMEKMREQAQAELLQARKEAQDIIARAVQMGEDTRNEIVAKAQEEAEKERQRAVQEIRNEKEKALAAIRDEAAVLAIMAAKKVLDKTMTAEDHQKLAREFIDEVGDMLC